MPPAWPRPWEACQEGRSSGLRLEYRILHHQAITSGWRSGFVATSGAVAGRVRHLDAAMPPWRIAMTRILTGLESRSHFEMLLDERLASESGSFCLLQFSVDHRSKILQLFGEAACDAMLAKLARIAPELRREDPFARWDEDGFILMLSQTDDRLSGLEIAERLRLEIADASLLPQRPVTVSIGLVQSQSAEQLDHLLARLASCHGQAKRGTQHRRRLIFVSAHSPANTCGTKEGQPGGPVSRQPSLTRRRWQTQRDASISRAPRVSLSRSVSLPQSTRLTSRPAGIRALFMMASTPLLTRVAPLVPQGSN